MSLLTQHWVVPLMNPVGALGSRSDAVAGVCSELMEDSSSHRQSWAATGRGGSSPLGAGLP